MSSSTSVQKLDLTLCVVQWYSVYVMLGVACQCHIRDFFHVHRLLLCSLLSASLVVCRLLDTQLLRRKLCLCVCTGSQRRRYAVYGRYPEPGSSPTFAISDTPTWKYPSCSFNSILCIEEKKAWWGTPATPFLALHIRRKTPRLSDEGEFFDCVMSSISQMGGLELHSLAQ